MAAARKHTCFIQLNVQSYFLTSQLLQKQLLMPKCYVCKQMRECDGGTAREWESVDDRGRTLIFDLGRYCAQ